MIRVLSKNDCCGCSACAMKCPKHCITMQSDSEGFLYPVVNEADCIDCGLCEKVCHELHPYDERKPLNVYAAINKDEDVRMKSSSGGIFYLLAEKTISEGGVVFGARFDDNWQVVLDCVETMEDVKPFMGSKYVQARTGTAYKDAETFLKQGRKVMFSGAPCQIAGLHHYLRKEYDNLTTVDFVCHGVPSPKVWERYLDEVVDAGRQAVSDVKFRNKKNGWKKFNFVLSYNENEHVTSLISYHHTNQYMRAFLANIILRPSCHECRAKQGRSHSDITIADFWGINQVMPEMDDDKGTGLVLINTKKGKSALDYGAIIYKESNYDFAWHNNPGMSTNTPLHPKRSYFFSMLDNSQSVIALIDKCLRPTLLKRLRNCLSKIKRMLLNIGKCHTGGG